MLRPAALVGLALAPLPAIAVGLLVASTRGVPWSAFLPNLVAVVPGVVLLVLAERQRAGFVGVMAILGAAAILGTLAFSGEEGVRRWLPLGPMRLNASAAFAPWVLGGLVAPSARARAAAVGALVAVQAVHLVQPDAGQASALAAGAAPLLGVVAARREIHRALAALAGVALVGLAVGAWLRADPLVPVDHVERVYALARTSGPLTLALAILATAVLALPFLIAAARGPRAAGLALLAMLAAAIAATFVGAFPVPVLGAGAGPVLGWYAMASVLARAADGGGREARAILEPRPRQLA